MAFSFRASSVLTTHTWGRRKIEMTRTVVQEVFDATAFFIDDFGVSMHNSHRTESRVSIEWVGICRPHVDMFFKLLPSSSILKDNLIWPAYVALGCIVLRLFNVVSQMGRFRRKEGYDGLKNTGVNRYEVSGSYLGKFRENLKRLGIPIVVFRVLRSIGVALLVVVSFLTLERNTNYQEKLVQIETVHLALYVSNWYFYGLSYWPTLDLRFSS